MFLFSYVILTLVIVSLWWLYGRESIGERFANRLMKAHAKTPLPIGTLWWSKILIITLVIWTSLLICYPAPREIERQVEQVILLDVSLSMDTDDVKPSRLERAKDILIHWLQWRSAKYGYIIFAGKIFVIAPMTNDLTGLSHLISETSTSLLRQDLPQTSGTNIGDALIAGMTLFSTGATERSLLLITDGRANIGLDPRKALEVIRNTGIHIDVIGIGSRSGSVITSKREAKHEPLLDASGWVIEGNIDLPLLKELTKTTSGRLIEVSDIYESDLSEIFGLQESPIKYDKKDLKSSLLLILAILWYSTLLWNIWIWRKYREK
jgi:Ca-activated chloride channel homolog